jgi:hypothetical protein
MKKLIVIFSLLLTFAISKGQDPFMMVVASQSMVAAAKAVYTDDFEAYSAGGLATQGNWIAGIGTITVADITGDNRVYGGTSGDYSVAIYNDTFANDQYAQGVYDVAGGGYIGIGVRLSGANATLDGYGLICANDNGYLGRFDNGTWTELANGALTISITDVVKLTAIGTELACYKNGSLITTISVDGKVTDATYSSGRAGIVGYADITNLQMDDWEGGDE